MREGNLTRFTDWKFIFKARLNLLPLNGAKKYQDGLKNCRVCGDYDETLPHVLNHCKPKRHLMTERHDRILQRLYLALPDRVKKQTRVNCTIPLTTSQERPDLVVLDKEARKIIMVDVTVAFDNGSNAMQTARENKIKKYKALEEDLVAKGFSVRNEAFVVGSLGSFPTQNLDVCKMLGINPSYAKTMAKHIISETIRWGRDIYTAHVTGVTQQKPRDLPTTATFARGQEKDQQCGKSGGAAEQQGEDLGMPQQEELGMLQLGEEDLGLLLLDDEEFWVRDEVTAEVTAEDEVMVGVLSPCHPHSPSHIAHPTSPSAAAKIIGNA